MLQNQIINITERMTFELIDAGVSISPLPGSPLAFAVNACYNPYNTESVVDVPTGDNAGNILTELASNYVRKVAEDIQKTEPNGVTVRHDTVIAEAVRVVSQAIRGNVSVAQNIVLPVVKSAWESVVQTMKDVESNFRIVLSVSPDVLGDVWNDAALLESVERYRDSLGVGDAPILSVHKPRTQDEIFDLLKTGSARFDKLLRSYAEQLNSQATFMSVVSIYNNYFVNGRYDETAIPVLDNNYTPSVNDFMGTTPYERTRTLLIHFIAKSLRASPDEGIDMSAQDYDHQMSRLIADTGRGIIRVLERRERDIRAKKLVFSYPYDGSETNSSNPSDAVIRVNPEVYNDWLKAGGRPEVLFGAFVTDYNTNYTELLEKADDYISAWGRRRAVLLSGQESAKMHVLIGAVRTAVEKVIREMDKDHLPEDGNERMSERLREELKNIRLTQMDDLYVLVRQVVCHVIFPNKQALDILERMDKIALDNPDIPIREVATAAVIDILTSWIADQFIVHRAKETK